MLFGSSCGNSRASSPWPRRDSAFSGSVETSGVPRWMWRKGSPSTTSTSTTGTSTCQGRAMAAVASRCHRSERAPGRAGRRHSDSAFTRGPRITSSAGSSVRLYSTAKPTTTVLAIPMVLTLPMRSRIMPSNPMPTVMPENTTVRPAVASVRASACAGGCATSSSRCRLTTKSE